jgi:hypothetical protein
VAISFPTGIKLEEIATIEETKMLLGFLASLINQWFETAYMLKLQSNFLMKDDLIHTKPQFE